MNKIQFLKEAIQQTDVVLAHIEAKQNIDIDHINKVAWCKAFAFIDYKSQLERELQAQQIVSLCLTGK